MPQRRTNPLTFRFWRDLLVYNLGVSAGRLVLVGLLFYVSLSWFTNAIDSLLVALIDDLLAPPLLRLVGSEGEGALMRTLLGLHWLPGLVFVGLMLWAFVSLRRQGTQAAVQVAVDDRPTGAKALILYLSPPGPAPDDLEGDIADAAVRARIAGPWRMPVEAIAYHLERRALELVAVIGSADADRPGTAREIDRFRELVARLAGERPRVVPVGELAGCEAFAAGVDFEDPSAVLAATQAVWSALEERGYRARDMLIDVTGGQKPTTIAGAAVALHDLRQFQYVSTRDYRVRAFDLGYHPQE